MTLKSTRLRTLAILLGAALCALPSDAGAQTAPVGWLDSVGADGVARGWSADRDSLSRSLWIHFYVDQTRGPGRFAGAVQAKLPRGDVERAGYPGQHGFAFALPAWLRDGAQHTLHAYAMDSQGQVNPQLRASPMTFALGGSASPAPAPSSSPAPLSPAPASPAPALPALAGGVELLRDPHMKNGVYVLKTRPLLPHDYLLDANGKPVRFQPPGATAAPSWDMAQHLARLTLGPARPAQRPGGALLWADPEKAFTLGGPDCDFALGINSRTSYGNQFRDPTRPGYVWDWPHLYASQDIPAGPHTKLTSLAGLRVRLEARLTYADHDTGPGYDPRWHTGHFVLQTSIMDRKHNDYLWYGANLYDARGNPGNYAASEMFDGDGSDRSTGKLIRNVPYSLLASTAMESQGWVHFEADLLPDIRATIQRHSANGNLRGSLSDFEIGHLHVGWEAPGLFVGTIEVRGVSLRAIPN